MARQTCIYSHAYDENSVIISREPMMGPPLYFIPIDLFTEAEKRTVPSNTTFAIQKSELMDRIKQAKAEADRKSAFLATVTEELSKKLGLAETAEELHLEEVAATQG